MTLKANKTLTIGGGSGQYALLSALRDISDIKITSVVSMTDNGGSTGRLRDELGILPPGDILKCIVALSPFRDAAHQILLKRLNGNSRLNGHNAGNMLLTMLSKHTGSFPAAIQTLSDILEINGRILPITTDKATLVAELTDGTHIYGESAIDIPQSRVRERIKSLFLVPHHKSSISAFPSVIEEIKNADYILIGPGDLYTSIIASLIVPGIKEEIRKASAKILFIVNIMTKFGETDNFRGYDFVKEIENYLGRQVDGIIYNSKKPNSRLLNKYLNEKAEFVKLDKTESWIGDRIIYDADLLDISVESVRHDQNKLASLIKGIVLNNDNGYERPSNTCTINTTEF
jgi:uncharacterized cofD-like protein